MYEVYVTSRNEFLYSEYLDAEREAILLYRELYEANIGKSFVNVAIRKVEVD